MPYIVGTDKAFHAFTLRINLGIVAVVVDTEVTVVGAGPTGLALACGLRLHGLSVRVVDRAQRPATTSRANFLHARGSEVLDRLGALGSLPQESLRAMRITTYLGGRSLMTLKFGDPGLHTAAPPMVVSQAKVEAALRSRLEELGVVPEWGKRLIGLRHDPDGVLAELDDRTDIRSHWLVGCDGTASSTRTLVGIGFPGVRLTERFLLADVHLNWDLDRSGTSGWIHPAGQVGAMPMPDPGGRNDLWRLFAYDPDFRGDFNEQALLDRLGDIIPQRTGLDVGFGDAEWLSMFSVHRRLADTYRNGRVLIAGDAAHAHSPFGGQGMLTGIGDAENLAFKLALVVRGLSADALIATYEAERRPLATEVLRGTSAVTRVNVASGPITRFLRDRVAARIFSLGLVQRWTTYTASQLWVSYRRGPLGGRGRKPGPGDRIADQPCRRPDGSESRLYRELGGRWALMIPSEVSTDITDAAKRVLGEYLGALAYDGRLLMLIRPDGHLAWQGPREDVRGLIRWLTSAFEVGVTR